VPTIFCVGTGVGVGVGETDGAADDAAGLAVAAVLPQALATMAAAASTPMMRSRDATT